MDTTKVLTHKFSNGREFTGTIEELQAVAKTLGLALTGLSLTPRGYYNSKTDGLIKIQDMHSHHIRRALLLNTKNYMSNIFAAKETNTEFLAKYAGLMNDHVIQDLLNELVSRGDEMTSTKSSPVAASAAVPPKKVVAKKATAKK